MWKLVGQVYLRLLLLVLVPELSKWERTSQTSLQGQTGHSETCVDELEKMKTNWNICLCFVSSISGHVGGCRISWGPSPYPGIGLKPGLGCSEGHSNLKSCMSGCYLHPTMITHYLHDNPYKQQEALSFLIL